MGFQRGKLPGKLARLTVLGFAAAVMFGASTASADFPPTEIGLLAVGDSVCVMLDADGSFTPVVLTSDIHVVVAAKGSPQVDTHHLRCRATIANDTGRAVVLTLSDIDAACGIGVERPGFQETANWRQVISASGQATLSCFD